MLVENATLPWGQSWERVFHNHSFKQFIALVRNQTFQLEPIIYMDVWIFHDLCDLCDFCELHQLLDSNDVIIFVIVVICEQLFANELVFFIIHISHNTCVYQTFWYQVQRLREKRILSKGISGNLNRIHSNKVTSRVSCIQRTL